MKKSKIFAIFLILFLYTFISFYINKDFLLPHPKNIFYSIISIISNKNFALIVFSSLSRMFIGLIISLSLGLILAVIAFFNKTIEEILNPFYIILKTIPNITFILISLIWLGREKSTVLVVVMVAFPIIYNSLLNALKNIDHNLISVTRIYPVPLFFKLKNIYFPLIQIDFITVLLNTCSLAFKIAIMSELISQVNIGIGKELYFAKSNFLMADIFAWTIIVIFISFIIDLIINKFKPKI